MPTGSCNLGFRFSYTREKLDCSIFPVYVPTPLNSYNPISGIGTIVSTQVISNRFVTGTINSQGAFSSIRFDPNGASNYGGEDFVTPGTPWEGYSFHVAGKGVLGGGNAVSPSSTSVTLKSVETNYISTLSGNTSVGHLITQIKILPNEPVIRMQMSYTNTTGSPVSVKAMRALDPDQGVGQSLSYSTQNLRGITPLAKTDIVSAFAGTEGMSVYAPSNRYLHNTGITGSWPVYNPDLYLSETPDVTADYAVGAAWNFGTILPNSTVTVCVYYIFGRTTNEILSQIF